MDNKEIALHLTVAAMNNGQIDTDNLPSDLKTEAIADFYFDLLAGLNSRSENE